MYNWHCNSKVLDIFTIYVQKFLLTGGWGGGEGGVAWYLKIYPRLRSIAQLFAFI